MEATQSAESVCPAGPDGVHYFFSDDECAYCHKLDQTADTERTAGMADALEFVWWQQLGLDKDEIDPDQSDGQDRPVSDAGTMGS